MVRIITTLYAENEAIAIHTASNPNFEMKCKRVLLVRDRFQDQFMVEVEVPSRANFDKWREIHERAYGNIDFFEVIREGDPSLLD